MKKTNGTIGYLFQGILNHKFTRQLKEKAVTTATTKAKDILAVALKGFL